MEAASLNKNTRKSNLLQDENNDYKLLVDSNCTGETNTKLFDSATYGKAIKGACEQLSIKTNHFIHIGRDLGPKELEIMSEANADDIKNIGLCMVFYFILCKNPMSIIPGFKQI